jgi:tRNA pseudouridine32 synthase/23S rRNA pseudouridine746 synthase
VILAPTPLNTGSHDTLYATSRQGNRHPDTVRSMSTDRSAIARRRSAITLPPATSPDVSLLEFLTRTFPHVAPHHWEDRLRRGKILDDDGKPVTLETPYVAGRRIFYYREIEHEPQVPFAERIVFRNDEILVADKPHFLPVVPGGRYVNECLEQRLRDHTGIADLVPLHRIDRETAGLVLCSLNKKTRGLYHDLFRLGNIEKTYEAQARISTPPTDKQWVVENRIVRGEPRFRMQIVPGIANTRSKIELLEVRAPHARFRMFPATGKTHQLRLHMSSLGFPILYDRYYPALEAERQDDFRRPLQLIARALRFRDPVTGQDMVFQSTGELLTLT